MKLKSGKRGGKGARKVVLIRCSYTVCGLAGNREIGNDTEECPILEREPERYGLLSKFGGGEGRCRWTGWPRRATRSWSGHRSAVVTVAFAFLFGPVQGAISPPLALATRLVAAQQGHEAVVRVLVTEGNAAVDGPPTTASPRCSSRRGRATRSWAGRGDRAVGSRASETGPRSCGGSPVGLRYQLPAGPGSPGRGASWCDLC